MNRRFALLLIVVSLAFANLWRGFGTDPTAPPGAGARAAAPPQGQDYDLARLLIGEQRPATGTRNLFEPRIRRAAAPKPIPPPPRPAPVPATPEAQDSELLALQAAEADLAQIRVVGIVVREGKGQAYLVKGEEVYLVSAGQQAAGRYQVERVTADAVVLRDTQTPATRRVALSGE